MDAIESNIDTQSDEYRKNFDAMAALVEDLKRELKKAREERSQKSLDRLVQSGKLPAQKKSQGGTVAKISGSSGSVRQAARPEKTRPVAG
jgi:hypothetical protein